MSNLSEIQVDLFLGHRDYVLSLTGFATNESPPKVQLTAKISAYYHK